MHAEELGACCSTLKVMVVACPPCLAGGGDSTADKLFFGNHAFPLPHVAVIVMLVAVQLQQSFT